MTNSGTATDYLVDVARKSAQQRREFHRQHGSKRHWHDPKKGEHADEYFGSLGNLVAQAMLTAWGVQAEHAPLFVEDLALLPPWDSKANGHTIEVKAIPPDDDKRRVLMLVKVSEFKHCDAYLAIKFWDARRFEVCGYATGDEVARAPIMDFGRGEPAYAIHKDKLPHTLAELEVLLSPPPAPAPPPPLQHTLFAR